MVARRWRKPFALSPAHGKSLAIIDATYGHLAPDADEQEAALPDTVDAAGRASRFSGSGQQTYTRGRFALGA